MGQSTNSFWSLLCAQCDPPAVLPFSHDKARSLCPHCTKEETSSERRAICSERPGWTDRTKAGRSQSACKAWALAAMTRGSATAAKICAQCSQEVSSHKGEAPPAPTTPPTHLSRAQLQESKREPPSSLTLPLRTWLIYSLRNCGCLWARSTEEGIP